MPQHPSNPAANPSGGEAPPGSALPIEAFYEDARDLEPEAFQAKHGNGFLLVTAPGVVGPQGTSGTEMLLDEEDDPNARTASLAVVVYPLRQRDRSTGHLVTLGRDPKHDVVIPDVSVSRFHAFAKPGPDGAFLLQDAGSSNGTTVNGASVLARGAGPPTPLKPGDTVKLGRMESTFTGAKALQEFALQIGG